MRKSFGVAVFGVPLTFDMSLVFNVPLAPTLYLLALEGNRRLSSDFVGSDCFCLFRVVSSTFRKQFSQTISGKNKIQKKQKYFVFSA
jgi:hypothetical protein